MSEEMMEHRIQEWITVNDLHGKPLRYGNFPLGMVQNFIERAEKSDVTIAALRQQLADVTRERDEARADSIEWENEHMNREVEIAALKQQLEVAERERDEAIVRYAGQANDTDNKHKTTIGQLENARAKLATLTKKLETAKETERILRIAFADAIQYRKIAVEHGAPSVNQGQFERLVENHLEELADIEQSEKQAAQPVEKKKD